MFVSLMPVSIVDIHVVKEVTLFQGARSINGHGE